MSGRSERWGFIIACLFAGCAQAADPLTPSGETASLPQPCALTDAGESVVLAVVGPQMVRLADGRTIQLAEILVPMRQTKGGFDPAAAAMKELSRLAVGKRVKIAYGGRERDRYGVYLAHVYVQESAAQGALSPVWLQEALVNEGLALTYPQPDNHTCAQALKAVETAAATAKKGYWALALFQTLQAGDTPTLMRLKQTYQIVEGEVKHVTHTSSAMILGFGDAPFQDFAVFLMGTMKRAFADRRDEAAWKGVRVRVRGFIEAKRGPFIAVQQAEQIDILTPAAPRADVDVSESR